MSLPVRSIARKEYDRNEGSRLRPVATDTRDVTAEAQHRGDGRRNGASVQLESLDLERMRVSRVSARERLERALGPDLTQLLLDALVQEGDGAAGVEPLSQDHAA